MKIFAALIALLLLACPASAQSMGEKSGVNSALGIAPSTKDFVKEAAISDMFEIRSSQMALQKSDDATKAFANQMIADHTKTTQELTPLARQAKFPVPTAPAGSLKSKLDKLRGLDGADFTRQYHADQVSVHKDAVSLFERYGSKGDNAVLRQWATTTLPTLQHHLQMARDLYK
jgi:putative membrane protein